MVYVDGFLEKDEIRMRLKIKIVYKIKLNWGL